MLKIEILEDWEARDKEELSLVLVRIEGNGKVHNEYGFVDTLEASSWINDGMNLRKLGFLG